MIEKTERITKEDFFGTYAFRGHRPRCAESQALCDLPIPGGMKMQCRWNHSQRNVCHGANLLTHTAERNGFSVKTYGDYPLTYCSREMEKDA